MWNESLNLDNWSDDFKSFALILEHENGDERHHVDIKYIYDEKIEEQINSLLSDDEKAKEEFVFNDLEMINYYYNEDKFQALQLDEIGASYLNFISNETKNILDYNNINMRMFSFAISEMNGIKGKVFGCLTWCYYDDIVYYVYDHPMYLKTNHILYVPDDIEDTKDAIREAAQKRIKDYFKTDDIKINYVSTAREYLLNNITITTYENFEETFEQEFELGDINENDYIYNVEIKIDEDSTNSFDVVIKKDSSKMVVPNLRTVDFLTGVEISTNSIVPFDTLIQVEEITAGAEYDKIVKTLNFSNGVIFDLKLYTNILKEYITRLNNGMFEVKIPIPEKLNGKNLVVYYVSENGEVEEYDVIVRDGYAIFETSHFSTYALTEKTSVLNGASVVAEVEENPNTGDNVLLYIVTGVGSLVVLSVIGICTFKKRLTN